MRKSTCVCDVSTSSVHKTAKTQCHQLFKVALAWNVFSFETKLGERCLELRSMLHALLFFWKTSSVQDCVTPSVLWKLRTKFQWKQLMIKRFYCRSFCRVVFKWQCGGHLISLKLCRSSMLQEVKCCGILFWNSTYEKKKVFCCGLAFELAFLRLIWDRNMFLTCQ